MGFFDRFRSRKKETGAAGQDAITLQIGTFGGLTPSYYPSGNAVEQSEAAITCIQTNATYCSKVDFAKVLIKGNGEKLPDRAINKILQLSPNPVQTASAFWERVAYFYYRYNNAFIYPERNALGELVSLWCLDPSAVTFDKISTGEIILSFFINGTEQKWPYSSIIHIARMVTHDAIFGVPTDGPIARLLDIINLNFRGIENAILTSTLVRFIGKMTTKVSDERLQEISENFTKRYLTVGERKNPIGILMSDSTMDVTPITGNKQERANYAEANSWNQSIYKFYGCPEKVIQGVATEDEMVAYYERTIEPFFMRTAQELMRKLFSAREYEVGNRVLYSDRKIEYVSMKTKLEMFNAAKELGVFDLGTLGDLLGLPVPADKRNVVVTSQNYNDSLQEQQTPTKSEESEEKETNDGSK